MDRKLSFIGLILCMAFLLFSCGGKKEEAAGPVEPVAPVSPEATARPLPAAETSAESKYESEELDYEVKTVNGVLNWSKGFIRAEGFGVPPENAVSDEQGKLMAFRAAYADALANLLEITNGVQVTATTTVKDYVVKDHTVELKVQGIIKGSKEVKRIFDEEKNVAIVEVGIAMEDVAMAIPKEGVAFTETASFQAWETKEEATLRQAAGNNPELVKLIETSRSLKELEQKLDDMAKVSESRDERDKQLMASIAMLAEEVGALKGKAEPVSYTGFVVNAAGSGIKPCMAPNIYYRSGDTYKLLYGIDDGRSRDANMHALAVWERTMSGAYDNTRVTQTPFVVNATYLTKEQSALAISADDAESLEKINQDAGFFEDGKVVIVR